MINVLRLLVQRGLRTFRVRTWAFGSRVTGSVQVYTVTTCGTCDYPTSYIKVLTLPNSVFKIQRTL